ncbi:MAG: exodeoxyribonuclease VII large subunit [Eubacterium sp.]|nr:exodeoxyribonuclease VII large subunit [Eubacterium sp.]
MITRALSVTEVNHFIKTMLDGNSVLKKLLVEGEISNLKFHSSGHLYFSLKDAQSRIACVMFRSSAQTLKFRPEEGMKVIIRGSVSVFERNGQYQVYARSMEPQGIGALYQAFEQLKKQYEALGWTDPSLKRPMPEAVEVVGIVTSPTGAAIRDMISVIRRRNPGIKIILRPALVQGEGAAQDIAAGIEALNARDDVDVIIAGRGGGSMEDLWAFNEAVVCEAIHASRVPVVSAVGHETDFTIADFVADFRAPTPSVAGELVAEDQTVLRERLAGLIWQMRRGMTAAIEALEGRLSALTLRLDHASPETAICEERLALDLLQDRIQRAALGEVTAYKNRLALLEKRLEILNPEHVLKRGYALARLEAGGLLTSAAAAREQDRIRLKFYDGEVSAAIIKEDR